MKRLIGLSGTKGQGKTTIAKAWQQKHTRWDRVAFADPIRFTIRILLEYGGLSPDIALQYVNDPEMKEEPIAPFGGQSTRYAMQTLGTEWGRNIIDENLWLNLFQLKFLTHSDISVICDDVRFPNEVELIKKLGGIVIDISGRASNSTDEHPSETMNSEVLQMVDYRILNTGTIDEALTVIERFTEAHYAPKPV